MKKKINLPEVNSLRWLSIENLDGEEWKPIVGYENYYEASNFGRIKSKERNVSNYTCRERILMQRNKQNYLYVCLSKNGTHKTIRVHRLIALTFLPNPDNLPQVNHKDENHLNNRVDNLEWCSSSYNSNYGTRIRRIIETLRHPESKKKQTEYKQDIIESTFLSDINNLEGEEWKPVVGYEKYYEISNYGRLKSKYSKIPFIVRTKTNIHGRMIANLHRKGKVFSTGVHVLVAKAFIPNPDNLPEVNHKDENPLNNHVDNLEWCTHEYNMHYGTLYQRNIISLRNNPGTSKPVAQYGLDGHLLKIWPSIREVKRTLNVKGWKTICSACKGKLHSAIGYQWRYIEEGVCPADNINPCVRRCSPAPKTVYQYTLDKVFVRSYKSITAAGISVGVAGTNISACIKGKQKSAAGFLWFDRKLNIPIGKLGIK